MYFHCVMQSAPVSTHQNMKSNQRHLRNALLLFTRSAESEKSAKFGNHPAGLITSAALVSHAQQLLSDFQHTYSCFLAHGTDFLPANKSDTLTYIQQSGNGFSQRFLNAIFSIQQEHIENVVVIGSDTPNISKRDISRAFQSLESGSVVLGPATDGGIWLLGIPKRLFPLLVDTPWCTSDVFNYLKKCCIEKGIPVTTLSRKSDIDSASDFYTHTNLLTKLCLTYFQIGFLCPYIKALLCFSHSKFFYKYFPPISALRAPPVNFYLSIR